MATKKEEQNPAVSRSEPQPPPQPQLDHIAKAVESSSEAIGICDIQGRHFYQNPAFTRLFGYDTREVWDLDIPETFYADPQKGRDMFKIIMAGSAYTGEMRMRNKQGREFPVLLRADAIYNAQGEIVGLLGMHTDLSSQKETNALLARREEELEGKSRELEEVNKALKTLIEQHRQAFKDFEQRILANVEDLVLPYVRQIKESPLDMDQRVFINVVESNLTELVAPFMRRVGSMHSNLSPREIEVANLVRMGATSKEISSILSVSKRAVEFHRDSLRRKLGLKKSKRNLRAYLVSLE
ncbi:MAG: PAS and helix-turn-helix domain-containing protein [Proteobacteria bacterium]|nr:PAS and helix-turn-helix domain-containing protein [Pseudomonadota bacterium]